MNNLLYNENTRLCSECYDNPNKVDTEHVVNKFKEFHGDKYDYSKMNYITLQTKIEIICPVHGSFFQTPNNHYTLGCVKCRGLQLTNEERINKLKEIHGDIYDYSKTVSSKNSDMIIVICPTHGEFTQRYSDHLAENGCQKCSESKGERAIREYLELNNVEYIQEHRVVISRNKRFIYDFYIPSENIMIEYDGIQHFKPIKFFGGVKAFKRGKYRDLMKDLYCDYHNLNLIRIPYFYSSNLNEYLDYKTKIYKYSN